MKRYTFIFEYNRGTYIKQVTSINLSKAISNWSELINADEIPHFDDLKQKQLKLAIDKETACLLTGMENVWCLFLKIGYSSHLLNIVGTL